jgi:DNA-binding protein H-NS
MSVKINTMSLPELIQLQKDLVPAIKKRQKKEKTSLRKKMEKLAKESGFTFDEVAESITTKQPASKVKPKYANPDDKEQTWTGRGRKPKWVVDALENGKELDSFTI